jgi:hypothetical protein
MMPATTQCPHCGIVLNLPPGGEGRRLRCPRCSNRFYSGAPGTKPPTSAPGIDEASTGSGNLRATVPARGEVLPRAEGDLRETFDLESMTGSSGPSRPGRRQTADAEALFRDDDPPRRKPAPAELRARSRRCPTCGTIVPAGMSLCVGCGLDLDTGRRVEEEELFDDSPPPAFRGDETPVGVLLLGGAALVVSAVLTLIAFLKWSGGLEGAQYLGIVGLFAIFASVQFLRGVSLKLLLIALTLGAAIDVVALIALPVYRANNEAPLPPAVAEAEPEEGTAKRLPTYEERLDTKSMMLGVGLLMAYAAVAFYLSTPGVRRHFRQPS